MCKDTIVFALFRLGQVMHGVPQGPDPVSALFLLRSALTKRLRMFFGLLYPTVSFD